MMVVLFVLILLVSFGVAAFSLRPSRAETDINRHIAGMDRRAVITADGATILKEESLSGIKQLNDLLAQMPGAYALQRLIKQSGSKWGMAPLVLGSLALGLLVGWLVSFGTSSTVLCLFLGTILVLSPFVYLYIKRMLRFQRFSDLLPEAIDLMARALRVGHSVISVLEMVGTEMAEPVGSEFRMVYEEQSLGLPLREAMMNLTYRVPIQDIRFLAAAIILQKETGGNLAEILDKTAFLIRERMRLRGQLRIYTAQGRATGWVLCALPFIMFLLISAVNPGYEKALLEDPTGRHLVYAGFALLGIGILVIRKIIDIRV
jgi:tight adherence protein B